MNASVRVHPRVLGGGGGVGVGHVASQTPTMPPPPLLQPSSLTSFFFHGSIRMLSGLNWFVALCVCCLRVSCRAFVSCVSDGWRRIILRRRSSPADGGRARRLGGTQIHRYYHHQPLLCPIIQTSSVPKPCRATPRRKPLFHHLCT